MSKAIDPSTGTTPAVQDIHLPFEGHDVRSRLAADGVAWFVAADVCAALDYANPRDAVAKHVDDEDKGVANRDTSTGPKEMAEINESGLYSLILRSRKPAAKRFKRWVTSEVLPALRKTGTYTAPEAPSPLAAELAALRAEVTRLADQQGPRLPPPPKPDLAGVKRWWAVVDAAHARLKSVEQALGELRIAVGDLSRIPRPVIAPCPVPRRPLPDELPHGGAYYRASLAPFHGALGTDALAVPRGHYLLINASIWHAWLGGDPEAAREIGRACDTYGLAPDAVGAALAGLAK